jgi:hypothetical protein
VVIIWRRRSGGARTSTSAPNPSSATRANSGLGVALDRADRHLELAGQSGRGHLSPRLQQQEDRDQPGLAREYGFTDVDGRQQSPFWDRHWAGTGG